MECDGSNIKFITHFDSNCNLILTVHVKGPDFGWWGGFGITSQAVEISTPKDPQRGKCSQSV